MILFAVMSEHHLVRMNIFNRLMDNVTISSEKIILKKVYIYNASPCILSQSKQFES